MKKQVRVILSKDASEVYKFLNVNAPVSKQEKIILNSLNQKVELIKHNPHFGNPISKKLIPKEYFKKYGINNLFRVELPNFWRMLYTLTEGETKVEVIAFVLDLIDHSKYNKKFGYRKR
jgi:hypothetical protein